MSSQARRPVNLHRAIAHVDALADAELAKDRIGCITIGIVSCSIWTQSYGYPRSAGHQRYSLPHRLHHQAVHGVMLLQLVKLGKAHTVPVEKIPPRSQQARTASQALRLSRSFNLRLTLRAWIGSVAFDNRSALARYALSWYLAVDLQLASISLVEEE